MSSPPRVSRRFDVIVVGGGIAGLTVAHELSGLDVLLLEKEPVCGGRTLSVQMGPYVYNQGAQIIPGANTHVARLADELGVRRTLIEKTKTPVHMNGRFIAASSDLGYLLRLPIPLVEKVRMGLKVLRIRSRYGGIVDQPPRRDDPKFRELSERTFADLLGIRHPDVMAHWDAVSMAASTLGASEVAAFQPVNTFLHHAADEFFVEGGTGELTQAMHRRLGDRVKTSAIVTGVASAGDCVSVGYEHGGAIHVAEASRCVMAVPAPIALGVLERLPEAKRNALEQCEYGAMSTAAFLVDRPSEHFFGKGVWRIPVAGKSIIGISDPTYTYPAHMKQEDGRGLIRLYAGNAASQKLQVMPDNEAISVFENDLFDTFPTVRGHVLERAVTHWPYAICPWRIGRLDLIDDIRAPHDNIHYCGDYTENSGLEAAVLSARRVTAEITTARGAGQESKQ